MVTLLIVESPNKIKKLKSFLPSHYRIEASVGHIRDLPKSGGLGITFANGAVTPNYETIAEKGNKVAELRAAARDADDIILATDPDREGEGIAWHIMQAIGKHNYRRATFNAITAAAVTDALAHPRSIDMHLVNAQQARRVLDRTVGWLVSPTCKRGTGNDQARSAGRVQSAALRIVTERELEIRAFTPTDYFVLRAHLEVPGVAPSFWAQLTHYQRDGSLTLIKPGFLTKAEADTAKRTCDGTTWTVERCDRATVKKNPYPPFTTSTVTQAASVTLGWSPDRTMKILQSLFEAGEITYHRTDSTALAPEAIAMARDYIAQSFPASYLPDRPHQYASKSANAQEAHEAIRPTHPEHGPDHLTGDNGSLYRLIWLRFIACQMTAGQDAETQMDVIAGSNPVAPVARFHARGSTLVFDGWRILMAAAQEDESRGAKKKRGESIDTEDDESDDGDGAILPMTTSGQQLRHKEIKLKAQKTKAPSRYTQASLIKKLEQLGIGRPSTYAAIVSKILDYDYITEDKKRKLAATDIGIALIAFLIKAYGGNFIDLAYTAQMEDDLDRVSRGELEWEPTITKVANDLLVLAQHAGLGYNPLTGEERTSGSRDPSAPIKTYAAPDAQRLRPCRTCQVAIGFTQENNRWIPLNPDGNVHNCQRPAGQSSGEGFKPRDDGHRAGGFTRPKKRRSR